VRPRYQHPCAPSQRVVHLLRRAMRAHLARSRRLLSRRYESEQKPGQIPGDVVLKLKSQPHPMFKRSGHSLSMKLAIPLRAALLGWASAAPSLTFASCAQCHTRDSCASMRAQLTTESMLFLSSAQV
jgi:hypothetical protein